MTKSVVLQSSPQYQKTPSGPNRVSASRIQIQSWLTSLVFFLNQSSFELHSSSLGGTSGIEPTFSKFMHRAYFLKIHASSLLSQNSGIEPTSKNWHWVSLLILESSHISIPPRGHLIILASFHRYFWSYDILVSYLLKQTTRGRFPSEMFSHLSFTFRACNIVTLGAFPLQNSDS